jgi:HD superfamily phosphohydrolase
MNKKKIINDPVYGFVNVPFEIIFDLIEHPWYQRLRRINQLGLTSLVYPGALHTRFHHAIGAMHLMQLAVENLRFKGVEISDQEYEAVCIAILLHDIGHGPFSHALEHSIIAVHHEEISIQMMNTLNVQFDGKLTTAIQIFKNEYKRPFFHQLISGQVDMDRLDYLRRDSFYTGVSEGIVGFDRIIKMLDVRNEELVIEEKGIYSIEKFIIARRLMYWQVYLHKTVTASESLLINILRRAKELSLAGHQLFATSTLHYFLKEEVTYQHFIEDPNILKQFSNLDDFDLLSSIKEWVSCSDKVLAKLCDCLINRHLPKVILQAEPFSQAEIDGKMAAVSLSQNISIEESAYFVYTGKVSNSAYNSEEHGINILMKDGRVVDLAVASDQYNISALAKPVVKYFLCYIR